MWGLILTSIVRNDGSDRGILHLEFVGIVVISFGNLISNLVISAGGYMICLCLL